jgi:hypothetical protein
MTEEHYAAHIKTNLDAAAINVMKAWTTKKGAKGKKASRPPAEDDG